jgi:hypothetical protein
MRPYVEHAQDCWRESEKRRLKLTADAELELLNVLETRRLEQWREKLSEALPPV